MYEGKIKEAIKSLPGPVENLPGMKILNTMPKPTNFLQLFNTFVTFIHHPGNGYTWDGRIKGGSAYKLLDGDVKSSECATFANAFMMLVWAPKPFGLQLPKGEVELQSYSGISKLGFVSTHPVGGVMGLQSNVAGGLYYVWDNHKVVKYQNRLYDVMYNTSYGQKEDMVQYQILENEVTLTPPDVVQQTTYHPAEPRARVGLQPGRTGCWFKEQPVGQFAGPSPSMPF